MILRRLRAHGLIACIPGTHRYRLTDVGADHAMLLTHVHTRLPATRPGPVHRPRPTRAHRAAHRRTQLPATLGRAYRGERN
jgi:hypothetical protein